MDSRDVLITICYKLFFNAITLAIGCSAKAVPGAMFLAPEILQVDTPAEGKNTHSNKKGERTVYRK